MARQALGVAGAAIGAYFGGPVGAQIGFAIGSAIGGAIDPEQIQGPKLGEAPVQTGRDGVPISYGWGIIHTAGNIIQKNPIVEVEETTSAGKGGGTQVVNTRRLRTFAIGVCRGPIRSILRIWQNDKLVYDARPNPQISRADSDAYLEAITIYLGDDDQLPDTELESVWGVGKTPAYRGLAYIVWNSFDITDFGSAIPQYRFEVEVDGTTILTSRIYPIEAKDSIQVGISAPTGAMGPIPQDQFQIAAGQGGVTWQKIKFDLWVDPDSFAIHAGQGGVTWSTIAADLWVDPDSFAISVGQGGVTWDRVRVEQKMVPEKLQVGVSAPTGSMTPI